MSDTTFLDSDAWLLLAIIYAGREEPSTLVDVIAAADYINHAVVVFEEKEDALARLSAGGYIAHTEDKPQRAVLDEWEDMRQFLGAAKWNPRQKPQLANVGVSYPLLTREAFDEAIDGYRTRHGEKSK